ncbi:MAG: PASTA domain-containing protein [Bacteroidota bacterium]
MSNSIISFLKSRKFIYSLTAAVIIYFASVFVMLEWLSIYTHHGEAVEVPDLRGMKQDKMEQALSEIGLQFQVIDSLFETGKKPGIILDQDPIAKSKVKKGRTIYLTVNAKKPPKVKMPNLIDLSYRHAETILESYGLKLGRVTYKPDLAKNAVLDQIFRGVPIVPGKEIHKGSRIDLVLGDGAVNTNIPIPDLIGLTLEEATFVLHGSQLEVGVVEFDFESRDTTKATVYRQVPEAGEEAVLIQGEVVSIYLH